MIDSFIASFLGTICGMAVIMVFAIFIASGDDE